MNQHRLLLFFMVVALLVFAAACTPPTPPPSPTPWPSDTPTPSDTGTPAAQATTHSVATRTPTASPTPDAVTITVWHDLPETQAEQLAEDAAAFQEAFPSFHVELHPYDSPENFVTSLSADEVTFDVVLAAPPLLSNLVATDKITAINDFFPPSFLDAFAAITLTGGSRDEQVWGLPDTTGFHLLLFYNRDRVDTPPQTMDDLIDVVKTLGGGSQHGLALNSYDPLWLLPWLAAADGWPVDEEGRFSLDPTATENALDLYLSWHDADDGVAAVQTYETMRQSFLNGEAVFMIDGEWAIRELSVVPDIDWGIARLPAVDLPEEESQPAAPLILGRYWAMSSTLSGDRTLAATTFLEFITDPKRQLELTSQFGLLPTRRDALEDPQIVNDSIQRVNAAQMQAGRPVPLGVNINALLDAMRNPLQAALEGEMTAQEAVEAMQKAVEALND
ncbi:MAG: extracellular solute-binding protein [Anaerolineae bacterium]|nr:extracellular solute-binding protein [Anaerolineae bacterium]